MKKSVIIIMLFCLIFMTINIIYPKPVLAEGIIDAIVGIFNKDRIYYDPGMKDESGGKGLEDMINDANNFENQAGQTLAAGGTNFSLDTDKLGEFSSSLYTILITVATAVSVIVGIYIGIKYMIGSVEQKAEYKKLLVPYLVGCIVVYGALGIWKLVVTILGSVY